jgi:exonuclease SbcC
MLRSIGIEGFQSHKETNIDFSAGVNAITGPSDSGKTAILRAISWLRTNRPSGEGFKSWYSHKKDRIAVDILTDKDSIAIIREDGKTSYMVNDDTFSAIKTDVPNEVLEALNISDYNFQTQHEKYFLLQDTPGEVARKLDELVGLEIIDTYFKSLNGKIRELSIRIYGLTEERDGLETALQKFDNLEEIEKLVSSLERKSSERAETLSSLQKICDCVKAIEQTEKERGEVNLLLKTEDRYNDLAQNIQKYQSKHTELKGISATTEGLTSLGEEKEISQQWLEIEPALTSLYDKILRHTALKKSLEELNICYYALHSCGKAIEKQKDDKKLLTSKFLDLLRESGTCPTCGTPISPNKLEEIEAYL